MAQTLFWHLGARDIRGWTSVPGTWRRFFDILDFTGSSGGIFVHLEAIGGMQHLVLFSIDLSIPQMEFPMALINQAGLQIPRLRLHGNPQVPVPVARRQGAGQIRARHQSEGRDSGTGRGPGSGQTDKKTRNGSKPHKGGTQTSSLHYFSS